MKKLSVEEAAELPLIKNGRETVVSAMLKQLKPGEALIITRADWKAKGAPYRIANAIARKTGRKFEKGRLPDGSGWVVKRVA
jgi:hypothetical protein